MQILIFLIAFLLSADENTMTRALHRPLVACTLFGAALGNIAAGAAAGAVLELEALAFSAADLAHEDKSFVLISLAAALLTVSEGMDAAIFAGGAAAAIFAFGYAVKHVFLLVNTAFVPLARKGAENRKDSTLMIANFIPVVLYGIVNGLLAVLLVSQKDNCLAFIDNLNAEYGWIISGIGAAGMAFAAIGIAILLRNLRVREMPAAFLAGAVIAGVMLYAGMSGSVLAGCAVIAFAAAAYDYHQRSETVQPAKETKTTKKGGGEKWW